MKRGNVMKKIALVCILIVLLLTLTACGNRQVGFDFAQTFSSAYILLDGEWQKVQVRAWRDFDDSDVVQIETTGGKIYLTHYMNVVLVNAK